MFCVIALVVLSILGIFSASNRHLAKEALDCVLRRVTLRPCTTGFDEKMKAKILGVVITRSEGAAIFLNHNFERLAWAFFLATVLSLVWTVRGFYLFYITGNCNGLNDSSFCLFDPSGANSQFSSSGPGCAVSDNPIKDVTLTNVDLTGLPILNANGTDKIVMIGCYACDYTRKVYPEIRQLVQKYNVQFIFADYPVKESSDYLSRVGACVYQVDPEKFWPLTDQLFAADKPNLGDTAFVDGLLTNLGLDPAEINACAADPQTEAVVSEQLHQIRNTNFPGTPTLFVNGVAAVGPRPYRVYAILLRGPFYWLK